MRAFMRGLWLALVGPLMLLPALCRRRTDPAPVSGTGEGRRWKS